MEQINKSRQGKTYSDKEASCTIYNCTALKQPLTNSPFVQVFQFGVKGEGYWGYNHMVCQLEDCIDCLKVIEPNYDYLFLVDHSSGHERKRQGGLDAKSMRKGYRGIQLFMRSSHIQQADGLLGPFHNPKNPSMEQVGKIQHMQFPHSQDCSPTDGPCWMCEEERQARKEDMTTKLSD